MRELGFPAEDHVARQLDDDAVAGADLVLAAATEHLNAVFGRWPEAMSKSFTMREFGLLGADLDQGASVSKPPEVDELPIRVAALRRHRILFRALAPIDLNIAGPDGDDLETARTCASEVYDVVRANLSALGIVPRQATVGAP